MTTLREAAQQALEALEKPTYDGFGEWVSGLQSARDTLRAALAEPVQEPVAWRYKKEGGGWFVSDNEPQYVEQWNDIEEIQPLYTAPPQRKPLTEEDIQVIWAKTFEMGCSANIFARAIERAHGIGGRNESA